MKIKVSKYFNLSTRLALLEGFGTSTKLKLTVSDIDKIKEERKLSNVYRFDQNISPYGYSPEIDEYLAEIQNVGSAMNLYIRDFPLISRLELRSEIAKLYNIYTDQIVVSTGIDNLIDTISRVFLDHNDYYITLSPDYLRFDTYSGRIGALPIYVALNEDDDFRLTEFKLTEIKTMIKRFSPKLLWLSNPNNPTGQVINQQKLFEIIKVARRYNTFVVVDEAQAEFYQTPPSGSCIFYIQSRLRETLEDYSNLIILRTFSKGYGLSSLRMGFLISSSSYVRQAILLYRPPLVLSNMVICIYKKALKDTNFIDQVHKRTSRNMQLIFNKLDLLPDFSYLPSSTNTFIFRHVNLNANQLYELLKTNGIIVGIIVTTSHIIEKYYLRFAVGLEVENEEFCNVCSKLSQVKNPLKTLGI